MIGVNRFSFNKRDSNMDLRIYEVVKDLSPYIVLHVGHDCKRQATIAINPLKVIVISS